MGLFRAVKGHAQDDVAADKLVKSVYHQENLKELKKYLESPEMQATLLAAFERQVKTEVEKTEVEEEVKEEEVKEEVKEEEVKEEKPSWNKMSKEEKEQ